MHVLHQEGVMRMNGGMREALMDTEVSIKLVDSCCLSSASMKPQYATHGLRRGPSTNRLEGCMEG